MISKELDFLYSLRKHGIKLGLSKMAAFMQHLGNVHNSLNIIHVAGTNGKGSCVSFIASCLIESGYKVGIYTSPHFVRYNERIKIGKTEITDDEVGKFLAEHTEYISQSQLTFFEVTTALAFLHFYREKVDFAVIETGLGGRFDATNVCNPLMSVITSIGLEHTEYLGDTIPEIAFEKAGIIKKGRPVCAGMVTDDAAEVFQRIAAERDSTLFLLRDYYSGKGGKLHLGQYNFDDVSSPLRGEYQKENAALACLSLSKLFPEIRKEQFENGLANVLLNTGFEGRFEVFNQKPCVIFDSAHNPDGIKRLAEELKRDKNKFVKTTVLFTALSDKNYRQMIGNLLTVADELLLTTINFHRALSFPEIESLIKEFPEFPCRMIENPGAMLSDFVKTAEENERLVVTGSMYLLGEVKAHISKTENRIFI